jgi:hypothetical protein
MTEGTDDMALCGTGSVQKDLVKYILFPKAPGKSVMARDPDFFSY